MQTPVGVEKVTVIGKRSGGRSVVKGSNPYHALLHHHSRRRADHDGATFPFRSIVLLLPTGRSGENHLLRLIDKHISFAFVREKLKDSYSETGRPSTDPGLPSRIALKITPSFLRETAGCPYTSRTALLRKKTDRCADPNPSHVPAPATYKRRCRAHCQDW